MKTKVIQKKTSGDVLGKKIGEEKTAEAFLKERDCHIHGNLKVRGRIFEGKVIKKFHKRITIEFERTVYAKKYERYSKSRTKIHARLPTCMEKEIQIGDSVRVQECRPLSKIIHFVVLGKVKEEKKNARDDVHEDTSHVENTHRMEDAREDTHRMEEKK